MKVCIFGAGSVGGYLAARLLKSGNAEISVIARGDHLRAIQAHGLRLITPDEDFVTRPHAVTQDARDLPPQDIVFVTLKSQSQSAAAADIGNLLADGGVAVFVNNGIPWWWTYQRAGAGAFLPLLDPDAALWNVVRPERAVGCVVYSANEVVNPGVVRHVANNQWFLGEPDGSQSARLGAAVDLLRAARLNAESVRDIRSRVWAKLLRNAPMNSLCALTRLPVDGLATVPGLASMFDQVVLEVVAIAAADGVDLSEHLPAARATLSRGAAIDGSRPGSIRPSMLQDVLQGRSMEVEAILGQVQAFARQSGTPSPVLDALVPLVRGLDAAR